MILGAVGGLLLWLALSPAAAVLITRVIRNRDKQVPR